MARRGRCAPARSTAKSPTAFAANGAPRSTPISDPSSKPHGEDRSEPSTPSASPSRAAPCLAQLENVNGDLSNYNLCLPVEGDPLAVTKAIDDRDRNTILPAGVVANINDNPFQVPEITGNLVKSGSQSPLTNAFQLKDPNVAEFARPAVAKHPGLGRRRPPETIVDKSLFGRFEKLLNLAAREFLPESRLFFRGEVSFLPMRTCLGLQLYMPVI